MVENVSSRPHQVCLPTQKGSPSERRSAGPRMWSVRPCVSPTWWPWMRISSPFTACWTSSWNKRSRSGTDTFCKTLKVPSICPLLLLFTPEVSAERLCRRSKTRLLKSMSKCSAGAERQRFQQRPRSRKTRCTRKQRQTILTLDATLLRQSQQMGSVRQEAKL